MNFGQGDNYLNYKIGNKEIESIIIEKESYKYPKYVTQYLVLVNRNAQATRSAYIGQLSELFQEYVKSTKTPSVDGWREWYLKRYPDSIEDATKSIKSKLDEMKTNEAMITEEIIKQWVEDLIITKTFIGLSSQQIILSFLAKEVGKPYRLATKEEESQGIDGFVGDIAYSVKPVSYKQKTELTEEIRVKMIYYEKKKDGLVFSVDSE